MFAIESDQFGEIICDKNMLSINKETNILQKCILSVQTKLIKIYSAM